MFKVMIIFNILLFFVSLTRTNGRPLSNTMNDNPEQNRTLFYLDMTI